ncbi:MAG: hypothetical protein ACHBN1_36410 [Heteroscytonema crispum UTEX LB 1556]
MLDTLRCDRFYFLVNCTVVKFIFLKSAYGFFVTVGACGLVRVLVRDIRVVWAFHRPGYNQLTDQQDGNIYDRLLLAA